jgi:hypothetical protein
MADMLIPKKRGRPKGPTKVVYHRRVAPELVAALNSVIELHKKAVPLFGKVVELLKDTPVMTMRCPLPPRPRPAATSYALAPRAPIFRPNGKL